MGEESAHQRSGHNGSRKENILTSDVHLHLVRTKSVTLVAAAALFNLDSEQSIYVFVVHKDFANLTFKQAQVTSE